MTDTAPDDSGPADSPASKSFAALIDRATKAGISAELRTLDGEADEPPEHYAVLHMPNGRGTRRYLISPRNVDSVLSIDFERFVVLGDYVAVVDTNTGEIEALVASGGPFPRGTLSQLDRLPGVEVIKEGDSENEAEVVDDDVPPGRSRPESWRLVVEREGVVIEFSPTTPERRVLLQRGVSIKIRGVSTSSHDTALEALERLAGAMLFDLDLVYGVSTQLAKRRRANRPRRRQRPTTPPKFPQNEYAGQALELYQYGRSAAGLPLLEYLAYYQSVEYFFPFFAREQTVNSVRTALLHPGFEASNDVALNRVINLAAPAGRGGMAEREQLRATLRACMTESDVRDFIESLPEHTEHFCSKNQAIKGVRHMQLAGDHPDLREQAADRIYAIRCRIVHAKQDGGGTNDDVLLPSSSEADSLQSDIELVRLVAQSALIARAARA